MELRATRCAIKEAILDDVLINEESGSPQVATW
jgi:hypothetical protein